MRRLLPLAVVVAAVALALAPIQRQTRAQDAPPGTPETETIDWVSDLARAEDLAREQDRPLLVVFR